MSNKKKNHDRENPEQNTPDKPVLREKMIWIVLSGALFLISLVMLIYIFYLRQDIIAYDHNLTYCSIELDECKQQLEDETSKLNSRIRRLERKVNTTDVKGITLLPREIRKIFLQNDIREPEQHFKDSLYFNYGIIPYQSTTGTRMHIFDRENIKILGPNRVFADFTDNEQYGWMLLEYNVSPDAEISFEVIDSYCCDRERF